MTTGSVTIRREPPAKSRPPGPRGGGLMGDLREFTADRLGTLSRWAREYGDLVSARFGPRRLLFVNHPDLVEEVLVHQNRKLIKHYRLRQAKRTLGEGLLTSEGDFWRAQRKLVQPAFHREKIAGFAELMVDYALRLVGTWGDRRELDVQAEMMKLTLQIVAKALFGADVGGESADVTAAMETLMHNFEASSALPIIIPQWVPTPSNLRTGAAIRQLNRVLYRIIAERRKDGEDRGDLLSMLLQAQDEESGRRMTDRQLRDECMTLFLAGHETTANTLSWAWYLLAKHPEAAARLREELENVLDGRRPSLADLPRLPYTEGVVNESLRLYPPAWIVGREAAEPIELGGYLVDRGTTLFLAACAIQRDPRWFDEPDAFRPERWAGGFQQRIPRYAYFPFGGGPRICIGNSFAQMEAALVIASIFPRYRLELAPGARVEPLASMTLRMTHGLAMRVERLAR